MFIAEPRARSGTYTSPDGGDPIASIFFLEPEIDLLPDREQPFFSQRVKAVRILLEDIPTPEPNGVVTIGSVEYALDAELSNNGYISRMQVK
jgi:hypothetical protein